MINYGKIAYQKVTDLARNNQNKQFDFAEENLTFNVSETEPNFSVVISSNQKVFFNLNLSSVANLQVFVNGNLEYAKNSFNSVNFGLFLNEGSQIKFQFSNCTFPLDASLKMLGNFQLEMLQNLNLFPSSNNLAVIKPTQNGFNYFMSDSVSNTLSNYQNNIVTSSVNHNFLSYIQIETDVYVLTELNGVNYIIKNFSEPQTLGGTYSNYAKLLKCSVMGSSFIILDLVNGKLNITLFDSNCGVITSLLNITLNGVQAIININSVSNTQDSLIHFVVTDANFNSYLVLCNLTENGLLSSDFKVVLIAQAQKINVTKTSSNTYVCSLIYKSYVKVLTCEINFNTCILSVKKSEVFNNATNVCVINPNLYVLNFNNTLIESGN